MNISFLAVASAQPVKYFLEKSGPLRDIQNHITYE